MKITQAAEKLQDFMDTTIHGNPNQAKDIILFLERVIGMKPPYDDNIRLRNTPYVDCCKWEDE